MVSLDLSPIAIELFVPTVYTFAPDAILNEELSPITRLRGLAESSELAAMWISLDCPVVIFDEVILRVAPCRSILLKLPVLIIDEVIAIVASM